VADLDYQNYKDILLNLINDAIITSADFVKRVIPFHLSRVWIRKIFSQAVNLFDNSFSVRFWNFLEYFCGRPLNRYLVAQISSSFFSSSQGIGSPGSFLAFQASSISIWFSTSCNSLSFFIEGRLLAEF